MFVSIVPVVRRFSVVSGPLLLITLKLIGELHVDVALMEPSNSLVKIGLVCVGVGVGVAVAVGVGVAVAVTVGVGVGVAVAVGVGVAVAVGVGVGVVFSSGIEKFVVAGEPTLAPSCNNCTVNV